MESSSCDSKHEQNVSTMNIERTTSKFLVEEPQADSDGRTEPSPLREKRLSFSKWLGRITKVHPCLVLENSGSVARDHLAAERTFLAYARTSLGLATMGVTLVQLLALTPAKIPNSLERMGKIIGALTALLGMLVMLIAVSRYFNMQSALIEGKYKPAGAIIFLISAGVAILILLISGMVFGIAFS